MHAHHAIFDPHSLEIEVKLDVILSHLWYVLLPEGEMGKSRNLLCRKAFMAQGVDSECIICTIDFLLYSPARELHCCGRSSGLRPQQRTEVKRVSRAYRVARRFQRA